jgi:hypothetical protein
MITTEKSIERVILASPCSVQDELAATDYDLLNNLQYIVPDLAENLGTLASAGLRNTQRIVVFSLVTQVNIGFRHQLGSETCKYLYAKHKNAYSAGLITGSLQTAYLPLSDVYFPAIWESARVSFEEEGKVKSLLGQVGTTLLYRILDVIRNTSSRLNWPLQRITVSYTQDSELENWKYVLLRLAFRSSFENADAYLHVLYSEIDKLVAGLDDAQKRLLADYFFYDVETI